MEQREHLLNAIVEDGALLQDIRAWLVECHDWMLSNDLDMQCPMETDPLDLVERIDRSFHGDREARLEASIAAPQDSDAAVANRRASQMTTAFERAFLNECPSSGPDHDEESLHYMQCRECGQAFDMRRLGEVCHHEVPGHERIPTS